MYINKFNIKMKKKFIKQPLKGIVVSDSAVGTRTPNILMGEHAGEYVRGDIMDANAVIQAFDELKDGVDEGHDTLKELNEEIKTNATVLNGAITKINKVEQTANDLYDEESTARKNADDAINKKINTIDGDSNTEGSFRKAIADVVGAAPEAYDTLKEIADKLKEDDDLHTAINTAIAEKAAKTDLNAYLSKADYTEDSKKFLTEHQSLSDYAKKAEIPTKVSSLTNDSKFITIADVDFTPYAKATDLTAEITRAKAAEKANADAIATKQPKGNYLTEHQSLADYAKKTDLDSKANTADVTTLQTKIADLEKRIAALEAKHTTA